jgi:hypothetical protein
MAWKNTTFSKKFFMASQYYQQLTRKKRQGIAILPSRTGSAGLSAASSIARSDPCRNDDLQLGLFLARAPTLLTFIDMY